MCEIEVSLPDTLECTVWMLCSVLLNSDRSKQILGRMKTAQKGWKTNSELPVFISTFEYKWTYHVCSEEAT